MLKDLIAFLIDERGSLPREFASLDDEDKFRALCNIREPKPVSDEFLRLQDEYLQNQTKKRGVVEIEDFKNGIALYKGDITTLKTDAIVNACNSQLLGCFLPLHNCIDNIIHSNAGVQVRLDCANLMQGGDLPNGEVKVTNAYNLPSSYIFHTVGPVVKNGVVSEQNEKDLQKCYINSLEMAKKMGLKQIAFCCISTGVYGYPKEKAAKVACESVKKWCDKNHSIDVIFDVFTGEDEREYKNELQR